MPQGSMQVSLSNYAALCKDLQAMNGDATKAIQRTVSDFKSRAPAWIGAAVTEEYTIKKAHSLEPRRSDPLKCQASKLTTSGWSTVAALSHRRTSK